MGNELSEDAASRDDMESPPGIGLTAPVQQRPSAPEPPLEAAGRDEMSEQQGAVREQVAHQAEAQLLYNRARAHDLAANFAEELHFDPMQLDHLEKTQRRNQDKQARLESLGSGDFDPVDAIRARYRMPQDLIRRIGNFTAEHVALMSDNPWQRLEELDAKLTAADDEIERLERAIAATKAEYFELLAART
jgi:hypothetical protein